MPSKRLPALWIPLAAIVITAAVYVPTLGFSFVCDDLQQIVWSQPNLTWRSVPSYFTSDVWSYTEREHSNYYRPLFLVWLMINSTLFSLNTVLWHLSAVATHLAATLLFYLLARRLVGDDLVAGIAALLFGVHPAHVEAVAWISAATESLFAIFAFGTILCHIRWRDTSQSRWRAASLLLFAAAIFSKETAIILPVLLCVYDGLFPSRPDEPAPRLWHALRTAIPYGVIFLLYLPLRIHALGRLAPRTEPWPIVTVVATIPSVLFFYLRQLLFPIQYSFFYPISPVRDPGLTNFYLPMLAVAVAAGVLIWISGRSRVVAFSIALLVAPVLPVLNLPAFLSNDFLHDRYLYIAIGGFSLLLALGIQHVSRGRRSVRIGIAVGLAIVLSAITVRTSFYWRDEPTLFTRAIQVAPENHLAQVYLGEALVRNKRYVDALPLLKSSLVGFPLGYSVYSSIARCYLELGDYNQAAVYLQDAITIGPRLPGAYLNLGMLELQLGQLEKAEAHARQALRLRQHADSSPAYNHYHFGLGLVLERKGDLQGAMAEYQIEMRENPGDEDVHARMLELQARLRSLRQ